MKHYKIFFVYFIFLLCSLNARIPEKIIKITFEQSMQSLQTPYKKLSKTDQNKWKIFSRLYSQHTIDRMIVCDVPLIPLRIHQIWIGSEIPEELIPNCDRWELMHPLWEYKLWTDADLPEFHLKNQEAFDNALNYGEKADIWRYEILERYGGVYVDMDMYCVKPLDPLHYYYDFYAGISNVNAIELNNALIACSPHHPLIIECVNNIKKSKPGHPFQETIARTGPIYFTRIFMRYINKKSHNRVIALPVSFFYPLPNSFHGPQSDYILQHWIKPETFTVHFWECRWMKPGGIVHRKRV